MLPAKSFFVEVTTDDASPGAPGTTVSSANAEPTFGLTCPDSINCSFNFESESVVSTQPGLTPRETKFGPSSVCNAVLKHGDHLIRCGFWRSHADALSQHAVGTPLALHQVNVYYRNGGWEVVATEATQIEVCPDNLRAQLLDATNLEERGVQLTQGVSMDYDVVNTTPATMSGLASVILASNPRQLVGVFEVHSLAVLGVTAVLADGMY